MDEMIIINFLAKIFVYKYGRKSVYMGLQLEKIRVDGCISVLYKLF